MKKIIMSLMVISIQYISAQESQRENTIETRLFPTYNSDFSYYFMRRDMRLDELLFSTEVITHKNNTVDLSLKGFIPVHNSSKWNYTIPIYFEKYQFKSNDNNSLEVSNLFGQSVLSFFPNNKWNFSHIIEFRLKGVGDYFTKKEGNFIAQFVNARYYFNPKLSITFGGLVGTGWDQNGQSETAVKPSLMLTYQPTKYFKAMIGAPGSAIEWSAPAGIDIMAHGLLDGDEYNTSVGIRKNIGSKFDITARYLNEGFTELYTPSTAIPFASSTNLEFSKQYQEKYQLELGVRPNKNTVLQLICGYGTNKDLILTDSNDIKTSVKSDDSYYVGINLTSMIKI